jgi:hemoglobin
MKHDRKTAGLPAAVLTVAVVSLAGCAQAPPTVAHTHIGHAVTGVHVTPNNEGYMSLAERRAQAAVAAAERADGAAGNLPMMRAAVIEAFRACDSEEEFGLRQSVILAANHLSFAATSTDASVNLQRRAPQFAKDIARVVERCELIRLLGEDIRATDSTGEAELLVDEIVSLARANLNGEEVNGDGRPGSQPSEFGVAQLRTAVDAILTAEDPPYAAVEQFYLFNLVRLPNGRWVYDQFGRGGNIAGYSVEEGPGEEEDPDSWIPANLGADNLATAPDSLYERLGGDTAMIAIVAEFTRAIEADDRINFTFADANLTEFKRLLFLQFCELTGGPCVYDGRDMYESHKALDITSAHFNALVEDLYIAFEAVGTPYRLQNELMVLLAPMQRDIVRPEPAVQTRTSVREPFLSSDDEDN